MLGDLHFGFLPAAGSYSAGAHDRVRTLGELLDQRSRLRFLSKYFVVR